MFFFITTDYIPEWISVFYILYRLLIQTRQVILKHYMTYGNKEHLVPTMNQGLFFFSVITRYRHYKNGKKTLKIPTGNQKSAIRSQSEVGNQKSIRSRQSEVNQKSAIRSRQSEVNQKSIRSRKSKKDRQTQWPRKDKRTKILSTRHNPEN